MATNNTNVDMTWALDQINWMILRELQHQSTVPESDRDEVKQCEGRVEGLRKVYDMLDAASIRSSENRRKAERFAMQMVFKLEYLMGTVTYAQAMMALEKGERIPKGTMRLPYTYLEGNGIATALRRLADDMEIAFNAVNPDDSVAGQ